MSMLEIAIGYAARGWAVFPIRQAGEKYRTKDGIEAVATGKEPSTAKGFLDATTDQVKIGKWWKNEPDRNIGLVTSPESGFWVLDEDIDKDTGEYGSDTLIEFKKEYGSLPPHPIATTPGGGKHHFFAWPTDGDVPRKIRFAPGLDALGMLGGKGGYLVAVPSVRPEGAYRWEISPDICSMPQAPAWLLGMIRADKRERPVDMARTKPVKSDRTSPYGRAALRDLCAEIAAAPFGQQEVMLSAKALRIGSLAYGGNIDLNEAFTSVVAAAMRMPNQAGREAWSEIAIERKIRTAFDKAALDPTPPPEKRQAVAPRMGDHADEPAGPQDAPLPDAAPDGPVDEGEDDGETIVEAEPVSKRTRSPFRYLGFNREFHYYLPDGKGQIVALRSSEHTALRLLEIADLTFWCALVGGDKVTKEQWLQIANGMMRSSEQVGIFDPTWVRGRGAWVDGKQVIIHTGSEAMIEGRPVQLRAIASRYVYEAGTPWDFGFGDSASSADAHRLVDICERLTWADPISGALLAGWNVIAPVCGALEWRPHIWITGPSGSGKTTALNDIVGRVAGPAAERFDGKATEASIRQILGYDARPVILDEAETEDQQGAQRMQGILDLARVASSGGRIPKGGANHKAVIFLVRSSFCFSSINTAVRHHADESRVSKLVLVPNSAPDADAMYLKLTADINAWFTPEYASAMFARSVRYLPTLLKNCRTFTAAAATKFKSRRAADQLGPMLAGYYLCHRTDEVSIDAARAFIAKHDWADYVSLDASTDEMRLFEYIMSRPIRVSVAGSTQEITIGTALEKSRGEQDRRDPYSAALGSKGIKLENGWIAVSDSSPTTAALFKEMPQWQADWKRPLRNLPGAERSRGTERFGPGITGRATWMPYGLLDGTYSPRVPGEDDGE